LFLLFQMEYEFTPTDIEPISQLREKDQTILFFTYLHLRSFKTPPSGAVMSDEDDADCAFSMRKGVKRHKISNKNEYYFVSYLIHDIYLSRLHNKYIKNIFIKIQYLFYNIYTKS
jgi:hypothetical protein